MSTERDSYQKTKRQIIDFETQAINRSADAMINYSESEYARLGRIEFGSNSERLLSKRLRQWAQDVEEISFRLEVTEAAESLAYVSRSSMTFTQEGIEGEIHGALIDIRKTKTRDSQKEIYSGRVCGQDLDPEGAEIIWNAWGDTIKGNIHAMYPRRTR